MAFRRPTPEGFDESLERLVALRQQREQLQRDIDDEVLRLTVEMHGPTSTIAERLKVAHPTVSYLRNEALKRRRRREQAKQSLAA